VSLSDCPCGCGLHKDRGTLTPCEASCTCIQKSVHKEPFSVVIEGFLLGRNEVGKGLELDCEIEPCIGEFEQPNPHLLYVVSSDLQENPVEIFYVWLLAAMLFVVLGKGDFKVVVSVYAVVGHVLLFEFRPPPNRL